jgi:hypothetical protein
MPEDVEMKSEEEENQENAKTSSKRKDHSDKELENNIVLKKMKRPKFFTKRKRKNSQSSTRNKKCKSARKKLDLQQLNENTSSGLKTSLHGTIYQVTFYSFVCNLEVRLG